MMVQSAPPPETDPVAEAPSPRLVPTVVVDPFDALEAAPVSEAAPSIPALSTPGVGTLVGPVAAAAVASSVDGMVRSLAAGRASRVYHGGPTIEDLVREEIRPLLKEWLDTHLPSLVERLVQVEVERVVGRVVP